GCVARVGCAVSFVATEPPRIRAKTTTLSEPDGLVDPIYRSRRPENESRRIGLEPGEKGKQVNRKTKLRILVFVVTLFSATVKEAAAQNLTVTPANPSISVGQAQQFTAPEVSNAADVVAGDYHACVLIQNGEARCAGDNNAGQLGNGALTDSSTPVPVLHASQAASVTTGGFHYCAVLRIGTVAC